MNDAKNALKQDDDSLQELEEKTPHGIVQMKFSDFN
jgi:hypothetical protein